jgi:uncharacterized protein YqjF (DUF2071 family)
MPNAPLVNSTHSMTAAVTCRSMTAPRPLEDARRQASTLDETDHRPWPHPTRHWLMGQTWEDLLFAHWAVAPERLQELVPGIPVDVHDGRAWLGVTPFVVSGLRLAGTPPVPGLSRFPELNVRTYVTVGGKPGIYFFSLDAASRAAVEAARRVYHLPYFRAQMSVERTDGWIRYASERTDARGRAARFGGSYRPDGPVRHATPGTLEYFLTERYCLYAIGPDGSLRRGEIHHPPWPLQNARADLDENTMPPPPLGVADEPSLLHYAARQDVVVWSLDRV